MRNCYVGFSYIYDKLIGQDYNKWADYIEGIFEKNGVSPSLILDLACGTGSLCCVLAGRGYDMIGVDISADMLSVAAEKAARQNLDIRFLCQSMTEFELYGTVDAVISTLDAVNYLTDPADLVKTFKLVKNYLNPGGLFIFDINTRYKLENILGSNTFVFDEDDVFYTWENEYDRKKHISTLYFTFFTRENGKYRRIDETHIQRAYNYEEITAALEEAGLTLAGMYGLFGFEQPKQDCEKAVFIAK